MTNFEIQIISAAKACAECLAEQDSFDGKINDEDASLCVQFEWCCSLCNIPHEKRDSDLYNKELRKQLKKLWKMQKQLKKV